MTKRKTYSDEFKVCAVARDLGVSLQQLKTWWLEQQAAGSAEAVELKRLRQQS